ncbi:MAG: DUF255 domain-containing protein [Lysobacterales bacterium]
MNIVPRVASVLLLVLSFTSDLMASDEPTLVQWSRSETQAFGRAQSENKLVLLYLEAVWCHWCHVMDQETYASPAVATMINDHFVALRVDSDARPDLANRYREFGWPATIFLSPQGQDLAKRQGFIQPQAMQRLLSALLQDPSPEAAAALKEPESFSATSELSDTVKETLTRRHAKRFDARLGGLAIGRKFMDRDSVEWDMTLAGSGNKEAGERARLTLDGALALVDPEWGGVYQYSTYGDWNHPHFEKLATIQGEYLRMYALAAARFGAPEYANAADAIVRYVKGFLRHRSGAFFASQDADLVQGQKGSDYFARTDSERRALGIPRIDPGLYARETGMITEGLITWYQVSGQPELLTMSEQAARWALRDRALPGGGFRHDEVDPAGPYLSDSLAWGRAFLQLYLATGEREWLAHAAAANRFIHATFGYAKGGYASAVKTGSITPVPQLDENISLARFANLLAEVSGDPKASEVTDRAMRYLSSPGVALRRITEAGILLVDRERTSAPLHLTVVGAKSDPAAKQLFSVAQGQAGWFRRTEWWDRAEGDLPRGDVTYPQLKRSALFVCTDQRCSLPIYNASELKAFFSDE